MTTHIILPIEKDKRFRRVDSLDSKNLFEFEFEPHLGFLYIEGDKSKVLIPGVLVASISPSSEKDLMEVGIGDLISVTADPESPVYKLWNPQDKHLKIEKGFQMVFSVTEVRFDNLGYPLIVGEATL